MTKQKGRVLVAYVTKGGATGEAAQLIGKVIHEKYKKVIDVVDLQREQVMDLAKYDAVIVGGGVRIQHMYRRFLKFLKRDFSGKKVAIFLSSAEAGEEKTYRDAEQKYIKKILREYGHIKPIAIEAFGGRIRVFGKVIMDNRDMKKIEKWAETIGKKF